MGTKAGGEMDNEKIGKWLEIAKQFAGGEFWSDIFEQPGVKQMMGTSSSFKGAGAAKPALLPMVDMLQADGEIVVLIDLPGVAKEQVELSAAAGVLYVKGTARPLFPGAEPLLKERLSGEFERAIRLPEAANDPAARITASYYEGVLVVRIAVPEAPRRSIRIE
ncbi:Hsp20/alpha crystallin family protein [Paenibacillus sp. P26]|nr:Hsp20/alpha crystallin family protein [Paenibacillus sp. P26]UUZ91015.1 Hsp20/alpha crystallin family protein [Paenibacillus sp. P25]